MKLLPGDLNSGPYLPHFTSIYIYRATSTKGVRRYLGIVLISLYGIKYPIG